MQAITNHFTILVTDYGNDVIRAVMNQYPNALKSADCDLEDVLDEWDIICT